MSEAILAAFHRPLVGAVVIALSSVILWAAFRLLSRQDEKLALLLLVAAGFLLRFYAGSDLFLHNWDERYHALVARNLVFHPLTPTLYDNPVLPYDYRDWSTTHIWLHKPPLTLWGMALSIRLLGPTELAVRLPSMLLSSLATLAVFGVGKLLSDTRAAFLAAFFFCINGSLLNLVGGRAPLDHVDSLMVTLVVVGLWFAGLHVTQQRGASLVGIGLCTGLALLTKWLAALLIPGVWAVWGFKKLRPLTFVTSLTIILLLALLVVLPWHLYTRAMFPQEAAWESLYNTRHIFEVLEGHAHPWTYYISRLGHSFGALVYVPILWFLGRLLQHPHSPEKFALAAWFLVPYVIFSLVATKMPGYVVISAPAVMLISADYWYWLRDRCVQGSSLPRWQKGICVLFLISMIILPIEHGIERLRFFLFDRYPRRPAWAEQLRHLSARLPDTKVVIFNTPHPIEAMFYTSFPAYNTIPSSDTLQRLQAEGYQLVCMDQGQLPAYVVNNPNIIVIAQQKS